MMVEPQKTYDYNLPLESIKGTKKYYYYYLNRCRKILDKFQHTALINKRKIFINQNGEDLS